MYWTSNLLLLFHDDKKIVNNCNDMLSFLFYFLDIRRNKKLIIIFWFESKWSSNIDHDGKWISQVETFHCFILISLYDGSIQSMFPIDVPLEIAVILLFFRNRWIQNCFARSRKSDLRFYKFWYFITLVMKWSEKRNSFNYQKYCKCWHAEY